MRHTPKTPDAETIRTILSLASRTQSVSTSAGIGADPRAAHHIVGRLLERGISRDASDVALREALFDLRDESETSVFFQPVPHSTSGVGPNHGRQSAAELRKIADPKLHLSAINGEPKVRL